MSSPLEGGFFKSQNLTPPASSVHSSQASYALPPPRTRPLRLGGTKESAVIRHIDEGILQVQRKFAQRTSEEQTVEHLHGGYKSFRGAGGDIEKLIDVIWISGTPSLQVPYLLSLALLTVDCIAGFPVAPRTMFRLLHKLDVAFASLIQGRDFDTGEALPGFGSGRSVTDTEKVRIKSLVERTRIVVVDVMSKGEMGEDDEDAMETSAAETTDTEGTDEGGMDLDEGDWDMEIAKVYDRTMVELGDTIGGTPIGIVTDS